MNNNRLSIAIVLTAVFTGLFGCENSQVEPDSNSESPSPAPNKPNIIVIYTDDMNDHHLGAFGGDVLTPAIDKLANEGTKLSRYYASSPVCSPSRYGLLTGRYASQNLSLLEQYPTDQPAFLRWNTYLTQGEKTIAHYLNEQGYVTGMVGKHHNYNNEPVQVNLADDADPSNSENAAAIKKNYLDHHKVIKQTTGFDVLDRLYANNLHALGLPKSMQEHNQDWITEGAVNFIENNSGKPFFLYMATTTPHGPDPLQSIKSDPRITPAGLLEQPPVAQPSRQSLLQRVKDADLHEGKATLLWIDDAVDSIVKKLQSEGVYDNTLIIFASDHNGGKGKMVNYEGGVNTPAFVWWQGGNVNSGKTIDALTSNVDILPTALAAAGVKDVPSELAGENWLPLLQGKQKTLRDSVYLEITYSRAVVTDEWKYIAVRFPEHIRQQIPDERPDIFNQEGLPETNDALAGVVRSRYNAHKIYPGYFEFDQLYNLSTDPNEQINLANQAQYKRKLLEMQYVLSNYIKDFPHEFGEFKAID